MSTPILLLAHSLGHGGGERQLALTALSIDRGRFQPHVACVEGGFWVERLQDAGIPVLFIRSRSFMSSAALREAQRLQRYIREHGIRIVQTFDYTMNVFGIPLARLTGGVVAISNLRCHMSLIPPRYRWFNHLAHRMSSAVVVNSEALQRHLIDGYRVPPRKVLLCHNGIETTVFHPDGRGPRPELEDASLVVGTVCVLRPEKNLGLLLEAFAAAMNARPGVRLVIVGSGPEEASLRARAQELDILPHCIFRPSTTEVAAWLRSMDVFVLPSLTEGFSNAIMEAMACGCCVIASSVGGNPELIMHGRNGLLFPSGDRAALVERLGRVFADEDYRRDLGRAASSHIAAQFSTRRAANCMQDIYERLLRCAS